MNVSPAPLVSLGDSFHDTGWQERMAAGDAARLVSLSRQIETVWVLGNHDPAPPSGLAGKACESLDMSADEVCIFAMNPLRVTVRHSHAAKLPDTCTMRPRASTRSGIAAAMFCRRHHAIDIAGIRRFDGQSECAGTGI